MKAYPERRKARKTYGSATSTSSQWSMEGFCTSKRSADGGVDGRIYFGLTDMPDLQSMVVEVKGGKHVTVQALRALRGVLDSEDALMAGLIIMQPLGKVQERNFRKFKLGSE